MDWIGFQIQLSRETCGLLVNLQSYAAFCCCFISFKAYVSMSDLCVLVTGRNLLASQLHSLLEMYA